MSRGKVKDFPKIEIANRFKRIRLEKKLTQAEFAEKLHCDRRTILNIESGKVAISPMVRLAVCNVFAVRNDWLLNGEGAMYDDRWALLEERAKELGEDIYTDLLTIKNQAKTYREDTRSSIKRKVEGKEALTAQEKEYLDKLLYILKHKDAGVVNAITQNIDTFLRVGEHEDPPGEKKRKKA